MQTLCDSWVQIKSLMPSWSCTVEDSFLQRTLGLLKNILRCGRFLLQHAFERCCVTDEIKDYHEQNFYDVLLPKSVDVIYDCVGQTGTGDHAFNIIKMHGSFVTFGAQTKCPACGYSSQALQSLNNIKQNQSRTCIFCRTRLFIFRRHFALSWTRCISVFWGCCKEPRPLFRPDFADLTYENMLQHA